MSEAKRQARAAARSRRRTTLSATPDAFADMAVAMLGHLPGTRVASYAPYGHEPNTGDIPDRLTSLGYRVWLPRIAGEDLEWVEWKVGDILHVSARGIPEPVGPADPSASFDVVLVPALAVDRCGGRLGQGGGYYDRFLAGAAPRPIVVAVVHDNEIVGTVPTEPHDQPIDGILTATQVLWCGRDECDAPSGVATLEQHPGGDQQSEDPGGEHCEVAPGR